MTGRWAACKLNFFLFVHIYILIVTMEVAADVFRCTLCPWNGQAFDEMMSHVVASHYGIIYLYLLECACCPVKIGQAQKDRYPCSLMASMEYHARQSHPLNDLDGKVIYSVERKTIYKLRRARRMRGAPSHLIEYFIE